MTTKNSKPITYGDVELDLDEFEPRKVKVRVTTLIDQDILIKLKEFASKKGDKYQSVLNSLLRSFFDKPPRSSKLQQLSEERVRKIVREELRKRA